MYQFIETILWRNGNMPLIQLHEKRFLKTQQDNWGKIALPTIEECIYSKINFDTLENEVDYKIRLVYSSLDFDITIQKYAKKRIEHLYIVDGNTVQYDYKYFDRTSLGFPKKELPENTEILFVKNNLLTDTSFTNIALYDGINWYTPETPLLKGVQRENLLHNNIITTRKIHLQDIKNYQEIALFNAIVDWQNAWKLNIADINLSLLHL